MSKAKQGTPVRLLLNLVRVRSRTTHILLGPLKAKILCSGDTTDSKWTSTVRVVKQRGNFTRPPWPGRPHTSPKPLLGPPLLPHLLSCCRGWAGPAGAEWPADTAGLPSGARKEGGDGDSMPR